ncbi:MAG: 1,4-alpha-glucan branching protein GlgB [Oscillospiraceae bacterium]
MPIMEYPYEGSWGYQLTGYFASSSRYGKPQDLMYLVDLAHQIGIGVFFDWVPAHFPKDAHGLALFDGTSCYEYDDAIKAEHEEWGTKIFDYSKKEVQSFLVSSAMFWIEQYHIDGIRVDAVSSMLYLDYGRSYGRWTPNIHNGNHNLEAIDFIKKLNTAVSSFFPKVVMIAEESSCFGGVTKAVEQGGLGFDFKWNMGWMNDSLRYLSYDPIFRQYHHIDITHAMDYQYSENYIMPLSHDEVVHLKKSMLSKMHGETTQKFASLRCFLAFMIAHPGKKITFMGYEIGQWGEWNYKKELNWDLLEYDTHKKLQLFVKSINHFYKMNDEFWKLDQDREGFRWIVGDDNLQNVVVFSRINEKGKEIVCIFNFSPVPIQEYRVGVLVNKTYHEIFSSNWLIFDGDGTANQRPIQTQDIPMHGQSQSICITIPANTAIFLK